MCSNVVPPSCAVACEAVDCCNLFTALAPFVLAQCVVGGPGALRLALTSRSLRFFGLLNAMSGGFGRACFSLWELWRIGTCFFAILARFGSPEWYVMTNGTRSSAGLRLVAARLFVVVHVWRFRSGQFLVASG